jgi:hypothetical protein
MWLGIYILIGLIYASIEHFLFYGKNEKVKELESKYARQNINIGSLRVGVFILDVLLFPISIVLDIGKLIKNKNKQK